MDWSKINWKVVGWVALVVLILLVLVALFVGITEALAAAGTLGAGAGYAYRQKQRQEAQAAGSAAQSSITEASEILGGVDSRLENREAEILHDLGHASDAEKVKLGEDLLGRKD
jgi:hypothetical protein